MKNNHNRFDLDACIIKIDDKLVKQIRKIFGEKAIGEFETESKKEELNFLFYPLIGLKVGPGKIKIKDERNEFFIIKNNSLSFNIHLVDKVLILPILSKYMLYRKFKKVEKLLLNCGYSPFFDAKNNQLVFKLISKG
jgi:hypothetical protein